MEWVEITYRLYTESHLPADVSPEPDRLPEQQKVHRGGACSRWSSCVGFCCWSSIHLLMKDTPALYAVCVRLDPFQKVLMQNAKIPHNKGFIGPLCTHRPGRITAESTFAARR